MKFIADHMLGKLAKWLRFLGYDTIYPDNINDEKIAEIAADEGRIILTRDCQLSQTKRAKAIYIESDNLQEQINQVVAQLHLSDELCFTRCAECNSLIEPIEKESIKNKVPEGVLKLQNEFYVCKICGRIYWKGTHYKNIERRIRHIFSKE
ncbi:MAG: Mut7-C RNAse domain-containing protein [Thermoplasmata archaeon]